MASEALVTAPQHTPAPTASLGALAFRVTAHSALTLTGKHQQLVHTRFDKQRQAHREFLAQDFINMIAMEDRRREEIEREIAATARHESACFSHRAALKAEGCLETKTSLGQRQVLVELCSVPPVWD